MATTALILQISMIILSSVSIYRELSSGDISEVIAWVCVILFTINVIVLQDARK
jgi:hypothetical protein